MPGFRPAAAQPPATPPTPGQVKNLFSNDVLWPCNSFVNTIGVDYDGRQNPDWRDPLHIPPHQERLLASVDPSQWKCDATWKNG